MPCSSAAWKGLFPHENAMMDRGGLEEERRLAYVAITRAQASVSEPFADAHAARPDALQRQEPFL
jgi:ATP-dependent exoDNAse (exonuclease V) beta subunit